MEYEYVSYTWDASEQVISIFIDECELGPEWRIAFMFHKHMGLYEVIFERIIK